MNPNIPQQNNQGQGENPYSDLIQQFMQKNQMGQGMGQEMMEQPMQPQPQTNSKAVPDTDITHAGVGSQTTQALMGAMNNINNFIKNSTDRDDIAVSQTILSLLADLLQRDRTTAKQISGNGAEQSAGDQAKMMGQGMPPQMGA